MIALQEIILDEEYDRAQAEKERFRKLLLASNLPHAKSLLKQFAEEDDETMAKRIDWDEHGFRPEPHSADELEDMVSDLQGMGFSLLEMGDS